MSASTPESETGLSAGLNARIFRSLAEYIREHHGPGELELITKKADLRPDQLDGRNLWISVPQADALLERAGALFDNEVDFMQACAWKLRESLGALRFVLRATSPEAVLVRACKDISVVSRVSRYEILSSSATSLHCRHFSRVPESRWLCLVRQGQTAALPTVWGLPPARLTEDSCVAWGDEACTYRLRFHAAPRWMPPLLGTAIGTAGVLGLSFLLPIGYLVTLPALGFVIAATLEASRANAANERLTVELNEALTQTFRDEAELAEELGALHRREQQWQRLVANQLAERTNYFRRVLDETISQHSQKEATVRGVSHDLRSPLTMLRTVGALLEEEAGDDRPEIRELVADHRDAVDRMQRMIEDMMEALSETRTASSEAVVVDVEELVSNLSRRLRALVHGRPIRGVVTAGAEPPLSLRVDALILNRIVDNLLVNAAKYTERGLIFVEVDGTEDRRYLLLRISDTGRGIAPEELERVFQPGGSREESRAADSYGLGLSVVVELLAQLGGHLEVGSEPGKGTTFWVYVPTEPTDGNAASTSPAVKIRKYAAARRSLEH